MMNPPTVRSVALLAFALVASAGNALGGDAVFARSGNHAVMQAEVARYMEVVEGALDTRFNGDERAKIADYLKFEFDKDPETAVKNWRGIATVHAQMTNGGPLQRLRTRAAVLANLHCSFFADDEYRSGPGKAFADLLSAKDPLIVEDCANKRVVTQQTFAAQARSEALVAELAGVRAGPSAGTQLDRRAWLKLDAGARAQFTDAIVRTGMVERVLAALPDAGRKQVRDSLAGALRQTNSVAAVARELETQVMQAAMRAEHNASSKKLLDVMGYGLSVQMMTGVLHPNGMAFPSGQ